MVQNKVGTNGCVHLLTLLQLRYYYKLVLGA
jgi:hypothetical protein